MQIDLCLDVEVAMPAWLARWRHPVVSRERWYPYKEETRRRRLSWWWWDKLTEGPSRELIVSLISGTNVGNLVSPRKVIKKLAAALQKL